MAMGHTLEPDIQSGARLGQGGRKPAIVGVQKTHGIRL